MSKWDNTTVVGIPSSKFNISFDDISDITDILIENSQIFIVVKGKVLFWGSENTNLFYNYLLNCSNICKINSIENIYFCLLNGNTLIFGNNIYKLEPDKCINVINYLVIKNRVLCLHSNNSLSIIDKRHESMLEPLTYEEILTNFLENIESFDKILRIKECLDYIDFEGNYYILYLSTNNTFEILDIVSLELINLNKFLDVKVEEIILHLNSYNDECYI